MSELAPLISDLALILICAGVMTLVFKRLKQPLVLGYIVAGFLASPHVPLTPSVIDVANIHTWSEIGVIFLLFALGLEFSFKKLVKVGGTAVIASVPTDRLRAAAATVNPASPTGPNSTKIRSTANSTTAVASVFVICR